MLRMLQRKPFTFTMPFAIPKPGSVILQADDEAKTCFYANSTLLSALSGFFGNLPPPSESDLVDGFPLITLPETSTSGLALFVTAIHSTLDADIISSLRPSLRVTVGGVIDAAIMAKRYDTPIIYRLLDDILDRCLLHDTLLRHPREYLTLLVWSIAGVTKRISTAAEATVGFKLRLGPRVILDALKSHAPDVFIQLQSLHLRRLEAPPLFPTDIHVPMCNTCELESLGGNLTETISSQLESARSIEAIEKLVGAEGDYGLDCEMCIEMAQVCYHDAWDWFEQYTSAYGYDQSWDEYQEAKQGSAEV